MRRFALAGLLFATALAQAAPPPDATQALEGARAQAKKQGKNVLVVFHASWCSWCKRFDKMLEDPKLKPKFEASYVILHLDVMESGDKKSLENPGGVDVMSNLGGKTAGLPFYAVVAPDGKKVVDSIAGEGKTAANIGYPGVQKEIAQFMEILQTSAKRMDSHARGEIEAYLTADASKR